MRVRDADAPNRGWSPGRGGVPGGLTWVYRGFLKSLHGNGSLAMARAAHVTWSCSGRWRDRRRKRRRKEESAPPEFVGVRQRRWSCARARVRGNVSAVVAWLVAWLVSSARADRQAEEGAAHRLEAGKSAGAYLRKSEAEIWGGRGKGGTGGSAVMGVCLSQHSQAHHCQPAEEMLSNQKCHKTTAHQAALKLRWSLFLFDLLCF